MDNCKDKPDAGDPDTPSPATDISGEGAPFAGGSDATARLLNDLRQSAHYHRSLFDESPIALYLQDFSAVEKILGDLPAAHVADLGRYLRTHPETVNEMARSVSVVRCNQAAVDLYKAGNAANMLGSLDRVFVSGDTGHFVDQVLTFTAGSDVYRGQARNVDFHGKPLHLIIKKNVIDRRRNGLSKVLVALTDITELHEAYEEKKRLTAQLLQAQKLEAIGTLAGGIAHDFNNILMGIQGRASLLGLEIGPEHLLWEHIQAIEAYVKSASELTGQLLGFARGGKYQVEPLDLNAIVTGSAAMFGRTRKQLQIQRQMADGLWAVEADRGQIEQVILNLLLNAWQAMPERGTIYLKTENQAMEEDDARDHQIRPGGYVKLSVTDTGIGMDNATLAKVFDPFFTTKAKGRGTGLGLASAYGIVKNHGGHIGVYSEKGHGTTFNVYLPACDGQTVRQNIAAPGPVTGTATILLVDDEEMILDVGKAMLEKLGYRVICAQEGQAAIETFSRRQNEIDLVILDMIMPDMGGGQVFDRLKAIAPEVRVLLCSGYSLNGQAAAIIDRGCAGFIQKPYSIGQLTEKLQQLRQSA